jgi:signal transduction histidine kinase/CheY-like chemotaxis protein
MRQSVINMTFDKIKTSFQTIRPLLRSRLPEIAAVVLLVMVGIMGWLIWEYNRTVELLQHTVDVEKSILEVFSNVQDAESGNRGYILTGDDLFLRHYNDSVLKIDGDLARLQRLVSDNPEQERTLTSLKLDIDDRYVSLKNSIELRRTKGIDAAIISIREGSGREAMEKVRANISQLEFTENKLHLSRIANVKLVTVAGLIAAGLALIIVVGSMWAWIWNTRRDAGDLLKMVAEREQNEMQIRQMQKIEAVGQLTGGLAHDFNNMLAIIIGALNLIQRRIASGDTNVSKFVTAAMEGATRAATLTSRLMVFSRQLPLAPQQLDVNDLVSGMSDLVRRTLGETITTIIVLGGEVWPTKADPGQLENAIVNLAVNARDAMPSGGKLTIETANCHFEDGTAIRHGVPPGEYIGITVTDTGIGMTHEVTAKAFDPFYTTKEVGKGTGLGLSQVYGFIRQMGGFVKLDSEIGHGTAIKMYLPRLHNANAKTKLKIATKAIAPDMRETNSNHIILVVEDEIRVREMSVASLRELGYTVIHADGAKNGLKLLDAMPQTTVLFTDIVMPEINGRQLATEALLRRPDLKVLYTTGFARDTIVLGEDLELGLHLIPKPFTIEQLAAKMNVFLAEVEPKNFKQ